jgi:hydroxymethylbilane synthase
MVASPDGSTLLRTEASAGDPVQAGSRAAEALLAQGAARILDEARE